MADNSRVLYVDLVRFFAILIVTYEHCAQALSGEVWTTLFGIKGCFVPFHMPLFMLVSGFFLNIKKIKDLTFVNRKYLWNKFIRLILPCIIWYFILQIFSGDLPFNISLFHPIRILNQFWFLTCLFICYLILSLSVSLIKIDNTSVMLFISFIVVLLCPLTTFCKVNFMYPFFLFGIGVRKFVEKDDKPSYLLISILLILTLVLYCFWDYRFSEYVTPFNIMGLNLEMIKAYIFRFAIGLVVSFLVIYLTRHITFSIPIFFYKLGRDTLCIYTGSFCLNSLIVIILNNIDYHITFPFVLEISSFLTAILTLFICGKISDWARLYKWSSLLLLGEIK